MPGFGAVSPLFRHAFSIFLSYRTHPTGSRVSRFPGGGSAGCRDVQDSDAGSGFRVFLRCSRRNIGCFSAVRQADTGLCG